MKTDIQSIKPFARTTLNRIFKGAFSSTELFLTSLQTELRTLLGEDCFSASPAALESHGRDESFHPAIPPHAIAYPTSTSQVAAIVAACAAAQTPIIPFGAGTSLEGHIAALKGGVCLDMTRMNGITCVRSKDMDVTVQAGATRKQLNEHLRDIGLFFSVDPGADATLGGMASTRASGTTAVRYGTMRDNVRALTVVLPNGQVMRTGRSVRKSSAGYDLTSLFVGAEGTLGVITELDLRLHPMPEAVAAAVCGFRELEGAVDTAVAVMQAGVPVARVELLDGVAIDAVNKYSKTDLAPTPTLFFEFHGCQAAVDESAEAAGSIATEFGGLGFRWAKAADERQALWSARHTAYYAGIALRPGNFPWSNGLFSMHWNFQNYNMLCSSSQRKFFNRTGCKGFPTDLCVPLSRLTECVLACKAIVDRHGLLAPLLGHVGDGNFHFCLVLNGEDRGEVKRANSAVDEMVSVAHSMGGTCTGEHGIGYGKLHHLMTEHGGRSALEVMHAIKKSLDPLNIMNPGKLGSDPALFVA